jgi:transposase-like protein
MKTPDEKNKFLDALRENHVVLAVCRKTGISKTTYYRWRQEDSTFAAEADSAIAEGIELVNDAAESNIITEIKNRDKDASKFWLKHRHPAYTTKIKVETAKPDPELSPEQEATVRKALELAALGDAEKITRTEENQHEQPTTDGRGADGEDSEGPEGAPRGDAR